MSAPSRNDLARWIINRFCLLVLSPGEGQEEWSSIHYVPGFLAQALTPPLVFLESSLQALCPLAPALTPSVQLGDTDPGKSCNGIFIAANDLSSAVKLHLPHLHNILTSNAFRLLSLSGQTLITCLHQAMMTCSCRMFTHLYPITTSHNSHCSAVLCTLCLNKLLWNRIP